MPQSTLSSKLLFELMKKETPADEMTKLFFHTKAELKEMKDGTLTLEITPDRLDMLSESGLGWALEGVLGLSEGLKYSVRTEPMPSMAIRVDPSVVPLREHIDLAVVQAPPGDYVNQEMLDELVRFQELLHATVGRDRTNGSIGLYPLKELRPPFTYAMEPLRSITFSPLPTDWAGPKEMGGQEFFEQHPMAQKYGALGRVGDTALTLRDSKGAILSLPPVLNSAKYGELKPGDTEVLVESTGVLGVSTRQLLGYMLLPFAARGWTISPVPIRRKNRVDPALESISLRNVSLSRKLVTELLGVSLTSEEVKKAILASRLGVEESGQGWEVSVPPWRPDILGSVDLAEEVVIARGLASFTPELNTPSTPGKALASTRFFTRFLEVMVGMGYQELHTPILISQGLAGNLCTESTGKATGSDRAIPLANPFSQEFSYTRPTLLPGLVGALSRNTGEKYPQRLFELGEVISFDPSDEVGARTEMHVALVDAGEGSGFARAAAVAERLARVVGITPTREPGEATGAIPGRVACLKFAGETFAVLGEVHPKVLAEMKIQEPVSWVELDLSLLWKLKGA
jgi:phenylalanyl-tRNA synthetase beta chain